MYVLHYTKTSLQLSAYVSPYILQLAVRWVTPYLCGFVSPYFSLGFILPSCYERRYGECSSDGVTVMSVAKVFITLNRRSRFWKCAWFYWWVPHKPELRVVAMLATFIAICIIWVPVCAQQKKGSSISSTPASCSGSNLGPLTDYPDWDVSWFSSLPPGSCRDSPSHYAATVPHIFHSSLIIASRGTM
jgi:hypothetical protein